MKPILLDFPSAFKTSRLLIRAPQFGDGFAVNEAIVESENSLKPWMPFVHPLPSPEETEENIRQACAKFILREDLRLHLYQLTTKQFIGSSGLSRMNWESGCFEIGYWLRDSASGHGYMTEAVNGIVEFAVSHLRARRIEIRCDARNQRSANVALRCGFTLEAHLHRQRLDVYGNFEDTLIFSTLFDEAGYEDTSHLGARANCDNGAVIGE